MSPICFALAISLAFLSLGNAALAPYTTSDTGSSEGPIFNPTTGEHLGVLCSSVESTRLKAFTDAMGQYRLSKASSAWCT